MRRLRLLPLVVVLALLVAGALVVRQEADPGVQRVSASFENTTNLYRGAQVKVLGVTVGEVTSVEVDGTSVRVEMTYDDDVRLPADVKAVVVPPSVVGDRFVQLTPAYSGEGPVLADDAALALDDTAVPLELDDTYRELTELTEALGPQGANRDGSLSRLVRATAATLDGNGRRFRASIDQLARALDTLAAADPDSQATVANTRGFTEMLLRNDAVIRRLVLSLARVSGQLNAQRDDIARASVQLSGALDEVATFVGDNRARVRRGVSGVRDVGDNLVGSIRDLQDLLALAPVGFVSALNINVPTNYEPGDTAEGRATVPGRTTSYAQRGAIPGYLSVQLGQLVATVCRTATGPAASDLGPFCEALAAAGGDLGLLLSELQSMQAPSGPAGASSTPGAGLPGTLEDVLDRLRDARRAQVAAGGAR